MQIVPFASDSNLPAYLTQGVDFAKDLNKDVVRAPAFPSMSIKGKVFTMNKDGVKTILMKPAPNEDETAQNIGVVIERANMNAKNFYKNGYVEGQSDGNQPDCYSFDGIAPSPQSREPQSKKCAVCPHNVWGSRVSNDGDRPGQEKKGKACTDHARLAIAAPDALDKPMLMRVPPASLKNLREAVKIINARKVPYNAVVMKVSFDPAMASPTLMFKPVGLLPDAGYAQVTSLYEGELVRSIMGLEDTFDEPVEAQPAAGGINTDELDAALAARAATQAAAAPQPTAAPTPAPTAAPTPAPTRKPRAAAPAPTPAPTPTEEDGDDLAGLGLGTAAPAPAPAPVAAKAPAAPRPPAPAPAAGGDLLGDLDALLGNVDG